MRLQRAEVRDFRNLGAAALEFPTRFTALVGPNGQGKTNTVEALYFVVALRALRNVRRSMLLRESAESARLTAEVVREATGLTHDIQVDLTARSRVLWRDGKKVPAKSYLGTAVAVTFTPDDLQIGKGSPDRRRRLLDRALLNWKPGYLERALRYQRALRERNKGLSDGVPTAVLDAYDEVLARAGAEIAVERARYVEIVHSRVEATFKAIADPAPSLRVRYAPSLATALVHGDPRATEIGFREQLARERGRDRRRGSTSTGPHVDDVVFELGDVPFRDRASQGQHRAMALALKLTEMEHLTEQLGEPPLLLLDDMSSELDRSRSRQLFDAVTKLNGQVILTSTDEPQQLAQTLQLGGALHMVRVDDGRLTPLRPIDS